MANSKYPAEIKQQALTLLAEGKSSVSIGKLLNVPATTVCTWGYSKPSTKKIPASSISQLITDYQKGISLIALEKQTGFNRKTISKVLKDQGVTIASYGKRIQSVKHNPFADLSNPEVNYWLGLLSADGHVLDNGVVKLSSIDLDILEKFATFTGCDRPLYGQGRVWTCGFMNKAVAAYLNELGITPRKSLTLDIQIPLTADFMRGFWEGDGSYSIKAKYQVVLEASTSSPAFAKQLELFMLEHNLNFKTYLKAAGTYSYKDELRPKAAHHRILITRYDDSLKLLRLLYANSMPTIERKFIAAQNAIQALLDKDIV